MPRSRPPAVIGPAAAADRPSIERILRRTALFKEAEIAVALEVLDVYLFREGQEDYLVRTARQDGAVAGYVCFGLNTMTEGTFELYWIAVDPGLQGTGIGSALIAAVERETSGLGGRMIAVETSSRNDYLPTLAFYLRRGYREECRVAGYYAPGDDKVILVKRI